MIDPVEALERDDIKELEALAIGEFRPRGARYDTNCDMPRENIEALFARGWLTTTLPKEMGGKGSNLTTNDPSTYLQALRVIARGCSSTAHCYQVQNHTAWAVNDLGTPEQRERFIKPMFARPTLTGFVGSEAKRKHMYMMNTSAKRVDGGFILNGEKNYATNGPMMSFAIIFAAIEGVNNYLDNHQMLIVEPGMDGVTIDNDWYRPNGMRAAASPIITLDNVFIPDSHVLGEPGAYPRGRWQGRFHLGFTANYLGTTEGMYEWCRQYLIDRGRGKAELSPVLAPAAKVALVLVILSNSTGVAPYMRNLTPQLVGVIVFIGLFASTGYFWGLVIAKLWRRPREVMSAGEALPCPLRSMRTTSAPRSDSSMPQNGPGPMPANSTTFSPLSGPWPMLRLP